LIFGAGDFSIDAWIKFPSDNARIGKAFILDKFDGINNLGTPFMSMMVI